MMDHKHALSLEADIPISAAAVWRGWTEPAMLMQWFCPRPWTVVECEIDLKPGGIFRTQMQSPEGMRMPSMPGCYLVLEPERRLVWTTALGPGFVPNVLPSEGLGPRFFVTVELLLEPLPAGGTRYRAIVSHADEAARQAHAAMGFEQGWRTALHQLLALHQP